METEQIINHYQENWGDNFERKFLSKGPMRSLSKEFCILEYQPNKERNRWIYATCGMSLFNRASPIELHLFSLKQDEKLVELLTAIAHYHMTDTTLSLNHTVNFGVPWQDNSKCRFGLISLPYLDGPKLESLTLLNNIVHFYWLIPLTTDEVDYKKKNGVEALEQRFEQYHLDYLNPDRKSLA